MLTKPLVKLLRIRLEVEKPISLMEEIQSRVRFSYFVQYSAQITTILVSSLLIAVFQARIICSGDKLK